jgi:hypothetical protein
MFGPSSIPNAECDDVERGSDAIVSEGLTE